MRNKRFGKNVIMVMWGAGLAQVFPILISPILTRLYSPEDFGFLSLYLIGISFLTIAATGKYENSIYLPRYKKCIARIVNMASKLSAFISIFVLFLVLLMGGKIWEWLNVDKPIIWLYIIPIAVYISAQYELITQLVIRCSEYKKLSISRVVQSISNGGLSIALAGVLHGFGLLIGALIGQLIGLLLIAKVKKNITTGYHFTIREDIAAAKKYNKYPLLMVPSSLLNVASSNMPLIILTGAFGLNYVGFYVLIQKALSAPSSFVGNSFGEVFRQQASDDMRLYGTCRPLFLRSISRLSVLSIIPFGILFAYAPQIFSLIFGRDWVVAGEMAQILVPMFFVRFIAMPVSSVILLRNKVEIDLWWQLAFLGFASGAFLITSNINQLMIYFSLAFSFMYIISICASFKYAKI